MPHEAMRKLVARTRTLTNGPFGINAIVDDPAVPEDLEHVEGIAAMGPAAIVLFWGDPTPYIPIAHRHGVKILVQVGSLDEAKRAAKAGADAVFAQGVEAGGHVRGTTPIWELLPDTVKALKPIPVLASGGIGDGGGLARAIQFGAQGVSLGTRFVACDETWVHPAYKQRVVRALRLRLAGRAPPDAQEQDVRRVGGCRESPARLQACRGNLHREALQRDGRACRVDALRRGHNAARLRR